MADQQSFFIDDENNTEKRKNNNFTAKKILIVDDEKEIRDVLKETLMIDNFSVLEAESGREAWNSIKKYQPDLVLMDVVMPGKLNGLDVYKRIRTEYKRKDIPVVFLTAFPLEGKQAREVGNSEFFYKPFSPLQLVDKIYDVLDRKDV